MYVYGLYKIYFVVVHEFMGMFWVFFASGFPTQFSVKCLMKVT